MRRASLIAMVLLFTLVTAAQKKDEKKNELQSADLKVTVVKDTNGKPVRNATVVLHPVDRDGRQDSGGISLKTDSEGKTGYQGLPYGKLRVQVIARGFQTFGDDFEVDQPTKEIVVKLKPPAHQYSIYDDNPPKN